MASFKPAATDSYPTATSVDQARIESILAQHRPSPDQPKPTLHRTDHLQWLVRNFKQGFPSRLTGQDASQPWLVFWTVQACYLLGAGLDPESKQRAIDTIMSCQHPGGGFSGGPHQAPHLLPTYAAVCALAVVGRPGPGGGWDQIDREKLYAFFMSLKQPDGSFTVAQDSEVDVRGTYCLLCVATLLNILTPELIAGTAAFITSLQTYEGGFASASQPYFAPGPRGADTLLPHPRPPLGEAHGGYTFCALAGWALLRPLLPAGADAPRAPDAARLVRWLVGMQGAPAELGGFRGRTNKLVDACYAWWVGGSFPLLRVLGVGVGAGAPARDGDADAGADEEAGAGEAWADVDDALFDRLALQEFILYAGQSSGGGLRDKPPKVPDAYHTLYALSGLATAQHQVHQVRATADALRAKWVPTGAEPALEEMRKTAFVEARSWTEEEGASKYVGGPGDRVNATHPIFNLTMTHVREIMNHFYGQR